MPAPGEDSDLRRRFESFASTSKPRAPLYASLSSVIADDADLAGLLLHAPPTQRLPVLLFACVHELLIEHPDHELARWYPNLTAEHRSPDDVALAATFRSFVQRHADPLARLLATRTTQTNEVGRCGSLLPALGLLTEEVGDLGLLDVGASGGLNLLLDRYHYRFRAPDGRVTEVGDASTVEIIVDTTGNVPIPPEMPSIVSRCGIDRRPVDLSDDGEAHWLEACVWPDQAERFHRLVSAIEIARTNPPEVLAGDAVTSLAPALGRLGSSGHPVVINSWVLNYLTSEARTDYLAELERLGAERDISWVYAEAPAHIPELPNSPDPRGDHRTVLTMVRWRDGERQIEHLATVHPHGFWMQWR